MPNRSALLERDAEGCSVSARWNQSEIEYAASRYQQGMPSVQISEELGRPPRAVANLAARLGLKSGSPRVLSLRERLMFYVNVDESTGCWIWQGSKDKNQYGQLRVGNKLRYAAHVSLGLAGRGVPDGLFACHHCDNPPCVNPAHLFVGTAKDNTRDCIKKGRNSLPPRSGVTASAAKSFARMSLVCDGHMTGENRRINSKGKPYCYKCHLRNARETKRIAREAKASLGLTAKGTEPKNISAKAEERNEQIRTAFASGSTRKEIVEEFGVSMTTVNNAIGNRKYYQPQSDRKEAM